MILDTIAKDFDMFLKYLRVPNVFNVYIFGSLLYGSNSKDSDVDGKSETLAILANKINYMILCGRSEAIKRMLVSICNNTIKPFSWIPGKKIIIIKRIYWQRTFQMGF